MGVLAGLVLVAAAVGLFFLYSQTEIERQLRRGEWVWVLVVGVDEGARGEKQANFIAAAGISPEGRAASITLPGELTVPYGEEFLLLADVWSRSGVEAVQLQVEQLLEIPLDRWVVVDFQLFRHVVDAVGGVEVDVEEEILYHDTQQDLHISIPAGVQQLDGETALKFIRYKGYVAPPLDEGEVADRQVRTLDFLDSLWHQLRDVGWGKWREIARYAADAGSTDMTAWELLDIARAVRDLDKDQATLSNAPFRVVGGEVLPDFVRMRQLMQSVHAGVHYLTRDQVGIALYNGAGERLLAHRTGVWLSDRGFTVSGTDNADRADYERSYLLSMPDSEEKADMINELLLGHVQLERMTAEEWGGERLGSDSKNFPREPT